MIAFRRAPAGEVPRVRGVASGALAVAALAAALASPAPARAATATPGQAVTYWIVLTSNELEARALNAPRSSRATALVAVAINDAVLAAQPGSEDVAAAGAASTVLGYLFGRDRRVERVAGEAARADAAAFALGQAAGARAVARGRRDGSSRRWRGGVPRAAGLWAPTPPRLRRPVEPLAGRWRTWNIRSGRRFRPPRPPALGTPQFEAEINEVYEASLSLTRAQRRLALYWVRGRWTPTAIALVRSRRLDARAAAHVYAAHYTAQADAIIAAWDAKYAYWSIRPVTAIRLLIDPTWSPLVETPAFPAYVSAHAVASAAAARVLGRFFPRQRARLQRRARQAAASRLYAGVHVRRDNDVGLRMGARIGTAAVRAFAKPHRVLGR